MEGLENLRKLLLAYRLVHFKDPYKEIDIGLDGRDEELCKPTLQLFYTLGASDEILKLIESTFQHFLNIKNKRKGETLEAIIYPIVCDTVFNKGKKYQVGEDSKQLISIYAGDVWDAITSQLKGNPDPNNSSLYHSDDFGNIYKQTITKMICDKFGAEIDHKMEGNDLVFDSGYLTKTGKIYRNMGIIKIKPKLYDSMIPEDSTAASLPLSNNDDNNITSDNDSSTHSHPQLDIVESCNHCIEYECYECTKDNHGTPVYKTNSESEYQQHWIKSGHKGPCKPGLADIEKHG